MRVIVRLLAVTVLLGISLLGGGVEASALMAQSEEGNVERAETGSTFSSRFAAQPESDGTNDPEAQPLVPAKDSSCAPETDAILGFVRAGETATVRMDRVGRIQYYALEPNGLGNINLTDEDKQALTAFTETVHRYGGKVDLVVAKRGFREDIGQDPDSGQDGESQVFEFDVSDLDEVGIELIEAAERIEGFDLANIVIDSDPSLDNNISDLGEQVELLGILALDLGQKVGDLAITFESESSDISSEVEDIELGVTATIEASAVVLDRLELAESQGVPGPLFSEFLFLTEDVQPLAGRARELARTALDSHNADSNDANQADSGEDPLALGKSFVLLNLVDEISILVEEHDFDGVTIDFEDVLQPTIEGADISTSFEFFLRRLRLALGESEDGRSLNLVMPSASEFRDTDQVDEQRRRIARLSESIDIFLAEGDAVLELSTVDDPVELQHKMTRVVTPTTDFDSDQFEPFGVAVWTLDELFKPAEGEVPEGEEPKLVEDQSPIGRFLIGRDDRNALEHLIEPRVCPNRSIIRKVAAGLGLVGLVGLSVWFVFYDLRRRRLLYPALASVVAALVLFAALVIADPFFEGLELRIVLGALLLVVLAGALRFWMKRNESSYP